MSCFKQDIYIYMGPYSYINIYVLFDIYKYVCLVWCERWNIEYGPIFYIPSLDGVHAHICTPLRHHRFLSCLISCLYVSFDAQIKRDIYKRPTRHLSKEYMGISAHPSATGVLFYVSLFMCVRLFWCRHQKRHTKKTYILYSIYWGSTWAHLHTPAPPEMSLICLFSLLYVSFDAHTSKETYKWGLYFISPGSTWAHLRTPAPPEVSLKCLFLLLYVSFDSHIKRDIQKRSTFHLSREYMGTFAHACTTGGLFEMSLSIVIHLFWCTYQKR